MPNTKILTKKGAAKLAISEKIGTSRATPKRVVLTQVKNSAAATTPTEVWPPFHLRLLEADRLRINEAAARALLSRSAWAKIALEHAVIHGLPKGIAPSSRNEHLDATITLRIPPDLLAQIEEVRGLTYLRVWIRAALVSIAQAIHRTEVHQLT